jgi:hypothetical protein
MVDQPGVRFGLGSAALVLTLLVVGALPLGQGGSATVALTATAALSTALPLAYAVGLAVQAWAYFTGFFLNQYGQLTFGPHDVRNLAGFAIGTVVLAQLLKGPSRPVIGGGRR